MSSIVQEFDRAADSYGKYDQVQRSIADRLVRFVDDSRSINRVLEIGCGTGNLTHRFLAEFPGSKIVATDASQRMLDVAAIELADELAGKKVVLDHWVVGNDWSFVSEGWDLIISNMTFQWIQQLEDVVRRLCKLSKQVVFSLPVKGTFQNWIEAHQRMGIRSGVRDFVVETEIQDWIHRLPESYSGQVEVCEFHVDYARPIEFVRSLKRVGGATPRSGHVPVNLRGVFEQFPEGIQVTYRVALVRIAEKDRCG